MNCIWMTVDSFRQDHVNCYRPEGTTDPTGESIQVQTPNMDRLASEGVLCERLRNEALPTVPARRGNYTGRRVFPFPDEPPLKGLTPDYPAWRPIPQKDVTVAEHLSENGYICGLVADVYHLMKPSQNYQRGFDSFQWIRGQEYDMHHSQPLPDGYIDQYLKADTELTPRRSRVLSKYLKNQMFRENEQQFQAAKTFRQAIQWLKRNHNHHNFFLQVESFDPHEPWQAPQQFIDTYDPDWDGPQLIYGNIYNREDLTDEQHHHLRARYAAECSMVDWWIGRVLDTIDDLDLADNTLVIVMSDHGKIIGEWNRYGMPPSCTGPQLNPVPAIIRHPDGENAGTRYSGWVYNTDLTVTMLNLLDAEDKPKTDGINFWPAVADDSSVRDHAIVGHGQYISCWDGDWLYLVNTDENSAALYNLADDPFRQDDVSQQYPDTAPEMKRKIDALLAEEG